MFSMADAITRRKGISATGLFTFKLFLRWYIPRYILTICAGKRQPCSMLCCILVRKAWMKRFLLRNVPFVRSIYGLYRRCVCVPGSEGREFRVKHPRQSQLRLRHPELSASAPGTDGMSSHPVTFFSSRLSRYAHRDFRAVSFKK